jgi:hypothetical protein
MSFRVPFRFRVDYVLKTQAHTTRPSRRPTTPADADLRARRGVWDNNKKPPFHIFFHRQIAQHWAWGEVGVFRFSATPIAKTRRHGSATSYSIFGWWFISHQGTNHHSEMK